MARFLAAFVVTLLAIPLVSANDVSGESSAATTTDDTQSLANNTAVAPIVPLLDPSAGQMAGLAAYAVEIQPQIWTMALEGEFYGAGAALGQTTTDASENGIEAPLTLGEATIRQTEMGAGTATSDWPNLEPTSLEVPANSPLAEPVILDHIIIGFEPGALPPTSVGDRVVGYKVVRVVSAGSYLVVAESDLDAVRAAASLLPGFRYAEADLPLYSLLTPNDTSYSSQYGPGMMGFPAAWGDVGYGSSAVKVAVIDSGLYKPHGDFQSSRILQGFDYVNGDSNPNDDCGHGTHVTGTVAATTNNGLGVAGMSQATILPLKALGAVGIQCVGSTSGVAQAILDASAQGAKIISMSIGGGNSATMENAVNVAWANGVLLVAAAGNDGASNSIDYPGAYGNVIAVGALTSSKVRASYSDMGTQLDIMAPGSSVYSTYNNGGYTTMSGTSMATPHVAGALALALSCAPSGTTNLQMRNALVATAEDLGPAGFDTTNGNGLARVDLLVDSICSGTPVNGVPTASFTSTKSVLIVNVDGTGSTDPEGDSLTYGWTFGDGGTASGSTASHTYASTGTYAITLTVSDGNGGSSSTTQSVTVSSDPDPSTPTITGSTTTVTLSSPGNERFYKIQAHPGKNSLQLGMVGGPCTVASCPLDAVLSVAYGGRPTAATPACPTDLGNTQLCSLDHPTAGWWYVRIADQSGAGSVTLTATFT